jgi:hypothetical protein
MYLFNAALSACQCLCCRPAIVPCFCRAAHKAPDESLLLGQTEAYVEYDRTGRVIKGQEVKKRSRCAADAGARGVGVGVGGCNYCHCYMCWAGL